MSHTQKVNLKYIEQHQVAKEIVINDNMEKLDHALLLSVIDIIHEPNASLQPGIYAIATDATHHEWQEYRQCFVRCVNGICGKPWNIPVQTVFLVIKQRKWYIKTVDSIAGYTFALHDMS